MTTRTAVYYYVPEDGDDEDHPNFFTIGRAANKVRLGDVKKIFPLPGAYHFRFKKQFKNTFVWLDILDDYDVVPRFEGQIVAKVSRLTSAGSGSGSSSSRAQASGSIGNSVNSRGSQNSSASQSNPALSTPTREGRSGGSSSLKQVSSGDLLGLGSPHHHSGSTTIHGINGGGSSSSSSSAAAAASHSIPVPLSSSSPSVELHNGNNLHSSGGNSSNDSPMMDLDWSSVPSPAPSPVPSSTPITAASPLRNTVPVRSSSPGMRAQQAPPKQKLQLPGDLSSAAKDFKL